MSKRKRKPDTLKTDRPPGGFMRTSPLPTAWADAQIVNSLMTRLRGLPRFARDPFGLVDDWVRVTETISQPAIDELERLLQTGQRKSYDMRPVFRRTLFGQPMVRESEMEAEWLALLQCAQRHYHHHTVLQRRDMRCHLYADPVGEAVIRLLPDHYPAELAPYQIVETTRQALAGPATALLYQRVEALLLSVDLPRQAATELLKIFYRYPPQTMPWTTPALEQAMMMVVLWAETTGQFEPVLIFDPHAGTGRGLMAAAMALPRWAVNAGLIQFIGLEADELLLRIGQLNSQWHTLKGWYLEPADLPFVLAMNPDFIVSDLGVTDEPSEFTHEAE